MDFQKRLKMSFLKKDEHHVSTRASHGFKEKHHQTKDSKHCLRHASGLSQFFSFLSNSGQIEDVVRHDCCVLVDMGWKSGAHFFCSRKNTHSAVDLKFGMKSRASTKKMTAVHRGNTSSTLDRRRGWPGTSMMWTGRARGFCKEDKTFEGEDRPNEGIGKEDWEGRRVEKSRWLTTAIDLKQKVKTE